VAEAASEGVDLVLSSISYVLPGGLNNLTLTGSAAIDGTGNELPNVIIGNGAANRLQGGWNNDTMDGGAGLDVLWLSGEQSNVSVDLAAGIMTGGDAAGTARAVISGFEEANAGEMTHSVSMTGSGVAGTARGGARDVTRIINRDCNDR
jgi:Ca2+-binding RTX toxin-like protein